MKGVFRNISAVLKTSRESSPFSQVDLSRRLGMKNGQFVSNIERGLCSLPVKYLTQTSKMINVPVEVLIAAMVADYEASIRLEIRVLDIFDSSLSDGVLKMKGDLPELDL